MDRPGRRISSGGNVARLRWAREGEPLVTGNAHTRALAATIDELGRALTFAVEVTRELVQQFTARRESTRGAHSLSMIRSDAHRLESACPGPGPLYAMWVILKGQAPRPPGYSRSDGSPGLPRLIARQPAISPADAIGRSSARPSLAWKPRPARMSAEPTSHGLGSTKIPGPS